MRVLTILMFSFLLLNLASCKTKQNGSQEKTLLKMDSIKNTAKKMYLFKNKKLELSEKPAGVYLASYEKQGQLFTRKLVKQ